MSKLRKELNDARIELDVVEKMRCTQEEDKKYRQLIKEGKSLPDNIYSNSEFPGSFMKLITSDLTTDELRELMLYKQTLYLQGIKGAVVFMAVVVGLPALVGFFILMSGVVGGI